MPPWCGTLGKNCWNWALGIIVVWLCVEGLFGQAGVSDMNQQLIHLALLFFLVVALAVRELSAASGRKVERHSHVQEKAELQREMAKSALRYKNLLEGAGDAIFVVDAITGELEEMNSLASVMLGYSREELGALCGKDLIPLHDQAEFISLVRRVNRHGLASLDRITIKRKDGSRFLGEVNARLIDLGDNRVVQAIVRDITNKWRNEEEIRERTRRLYLLNNIIAKVNESLDLQTVLDITLRETVAACGGVGGAIHLATEEASHLTLVAHHNLTQHFIGTTARLAVRERPSCPANVHQRCHAVTDPTATPCPLASSDLGDAGKGIVGIPLAAQKRLVGIMHVITGHPWQHTSEDLSFFATVGSQIGIAIDHARIFSELNRKNEELSHSHNLLENNARRLAISQSKLENNLAVVETAKGELERLDRMKNHFLGLVSHEFRTPLTGILSGVEYLLAHPEKERTEEEQRLLEMIQHGGSRLNEIVSNLLKVVRLEARGGGTVTKAALQLTEVVATVEGQLRHLLEQRNQRISLRNLDELPYFYGDRDHLEEVFTELLINAMKFTPDSGEIVISGSLADRTSLAAREQTLCRFNPLFYPEVGTKSYLQVEVRDSGIGIAFDEQLKIFDKFYEVGEICHHSSGKHKFQGKGAGLGLAIVKGMVEAHGGMVWVESPPGTGEGSTFVMLFPLEEGANQQPLPFNA
ncbi:MAG TPA: ATP-binding protein [Geobacteraceae bacterium]